MTAKTSASAFNSYFYQQQNQQQHSNKQMDQNLNNEQLNDLHLKMSKKIAQLTKVIYALNSKNDESENLIANLRVQFEEEKEILLNDTNRKLEEFKQKLLNNNDQSSKISSLESALKDFQIQKERALKEMEEFKLKSIQNEENLVLAHKQELIDLNKMLEKLKQENEKQFKQFETTNKKYEQEKLYLIEDLKSKHRLEIENLKQSYSSNKDNFQQEKKLLEDKFNSEIQKLKLDFENLSSKSSKEKQEYEQNILKLKSFHEKELDALKQNSSSEYEKLIANLKQEFDLLYKEKVSKEHDLNQQLNKKLEELLDKEDQIKILNQKILNLNLNIEDSSKNYVDLNEKIIELTSKNQSLESKLVESEFENNSIKEKSEIQSRQLVEKSSELSKLEASLMQKTSTISDLKHELTETKKRLNQLEQDRKHLENDSLSQNDKFTLLVKQLEKQIELLNNEKTNISTEYREKIESLNFENKTQIEKIKTDFNIEKQELINQFESKISMEKALYEEKILKIEHDLTKDFNSENQKLLNENNDLKIRLDSMNEDYKMKSKKLEEELKTMEEFLNKTKLELNQNLELNKKLEFNNSKLEVDLKKNEKLCSDQKLRIEELEKDIEQLKFLFESTSKDTQLEFKIKMDKLNKDLNSKWSETLRVETEKLRLELQRVKEVEKNYELEKLSSLKDEEIKNLKLIWQTKTNELLDEISALKKELNEKEMKSNETIEKIKLDLELENRDLIEKLNRLNDEYKSKLDQLQSQQSLETKTLIDNLVKENEAKINELKNRHLEDLKSQSIAQRAALASLKSTLENTKQLELEKQNEANNKKLELLKYELQEEYYNEIDKLRHEHELEIITIRDELERVVEQSRQKEREHQVKIDEYHTEIWQKQKQIDKINNELMEIKMLNNTLKEEIELKSKELKQIRVDVMNEIKTKEAIIQQKKEDEINRLNLEHMKQKQLLVNEFKQAQELLKQKIIDTDKELRDMHDRFLNRESREEDLELIKVLRRNLGERDELLKKLQNEKQYFQMELVNRENNFNKMFNVSPNIGTINPLNANTKIKIKSSTNQTRQQLTHQSSSSAGRLEPIPGIGSPLHDLTLNPNKPLPKKFLS